MIRYAIDLTRYHFQKRQGELALYGTWYGDKARPCLVVVPTNHIGHDRCRPLVITIDDAWQWNPDDTDAMPETNAAMVQQFLDVNGMDFGNMRSAMRVVSLIHDHLGDLISIPPKASLARVVADVLQVDHDTGKETHAEIIDRV
ncbi:hypothetical protein FJU08_06815 [Martelella alba]|uniref:Uncharacterized protein n=1 Tax=Martelella alba TaxID=2590451 RepID=A0A506UBP9_9HYPH|nr:hypothetical protein FJU08_06815 [Martelella alba]